MSHEAVSWALDDAPMLLTAAGKPDVTARFVLVAVAERADKNGQNAHPSIADIRYRTGADRSTVQRALRRLESAKLLERDGRIGGRTRWRLAMDTHRPPSDWTEIEDQEDAERASTAERVRRSRATSRVTGATPVTEAVVTGAESATGSDVTAPAPVTSLRVLGPAPVTEADVTGSEPITGIVVTGIAPVRNALNARTEPDVTGVTQPEPSNYLTTQEPPCSETPPSSESPRGGAQATIDGDPAPPPPKKRGRSSKPKVERTPEQQELFDAADKIGHWWWDVRCPKLGISVKNTRTFPGFRDDLFAYLTASPPCTKQEVQQALEACGQSWPASGKFETAIKDLRNRTPGQTNDRKQQATDDLFGRAFERAKIRDAQEAS